MRRRLIGVPALAVVLVMSGCASSTYSDETAEIFRDDVKVVSEASARGELDAALSALDRLVVELAAALESGRLDDRRFDHIMATVALVRSELQSMIAAQEAGEAESAPRSQESGGGDGGEGAGNGDGGSKGGEGKRGKKDHGD